MSKSEFSDLNDFPPVDQTPTTPASPHSYTNCPPGHLTSAGYDQFSPRPEVLTNTTSPVVTTEPDAAVVVADDEGPPPRGSMVFSIVTFLFCNIIFGCLGIYFSMEASKYAYRGANRKARRMSDYAHCMNFLGIFISTGIIITVIVIKVHDGH